MSHTFYLPIAPGTPDNVIAGAQALTGAIGRIQREHNLDGADVMFVLASIVAGATVTTSEGDVDMAGDAFARWATLATMLIAGVLDQARDAPAGTHADEPEIAALKAARGPSSAIN